MLPHRPGSVDPVRDMEIIHGELRKKDIAVRPCPLLWAAVSHRQPLAPDTNCGVSRCGEQRVENLLAVVAKKTRTKDAKAAQEEIVRGAGRVLARGCADP